MNNFLPQLFDTEIAKLRSEINSFKDEANMWKTTNGISNSAGNLALHLIGNLNHFIGATLGNTGYVRKRDEEFSRKDVPREQVIAELDKVKEVAMSVLGSLTDAQLQQEF